MSEKKKKKNTPSGSSLDAKNALVPVDSLQLYMQKINQYSLLSAEEEHRLAVDFYHSANPKAAYELTVRNLRLVVKIAMEYRKAWSNVLDLIQEGNIGLMSAIQRFDPYRQTRLSTYAAWWIRAYILKFIMNNWRLIKIGNTQAERKLFYNLRKEQEKLLAEGYVPGPKLLAERLQVPEKDVIDMSKRLGDSEVSLDLPQSRQNRSGEWLDGRAMSESISDGTENIDDALGNKELKTILREAMKDIRKNLKPRDLLLLDKRILAEEPVTLREIGEEMGISRERVRQIEERLMKKIKQMITEKFPDLKIEDK